MIFKTPLPTKCEICVKDTNVNLTAIKTGVRCLATLCLVLGNWLGGASWAMAQGDIGVRVLGDMTSIEVEQNGAKALQLSVPFVLINSTDQVLNQEIKAADLTFAVREIGGTVRNTKVQAQLAKPSGRLHVVIVLDDSSVLNANDFNVLKDALGKTIDQIPQNSLITLLPLVGQPNLPTEKKDDLQKLLAVFPQQKSRGCLDRKILEAMGILNTWGERRAIVLATASRETCIDLNQLVATAKQLRSPIHAIGVEGYSVTKGDLEQYSKPTGGLAVTSSANAFAMLGAFSKLFPVFSQQQTAIFTIFAPKDNYKGEMLVTTQGNPRIAIPFETSKSYVGPPALAIDGNVFATNDGVRFKLNIESRSLMERLEFRFKELASGAAGPTVPIAAGTVPEVVPISVPLKRGVEYELQVVARDSTGAQIATAPPVKFRYDPQAVDLLINSSLNANSLKPTMFVTFTLSDPTGVASYYVLVESKDKNGAKTEKRSSQLNSSVEVDMSTLPSGDYRLIAEAYDNKNPPQKLAELKTPLEFSYTPLGFFQRLSLWISTTFNESPGLAVAVLAVVLLGFIALFVLARLTRQAPSLGPQDVAIGMQRAPSGGKAKPNFARIPSFDTSIDNAKSVVDVDPIKLSGKSAGDGFTPAFLKLVEPTTSSFELTLNKTSLSVGREATAQAQIPVDRSYGVSSIHATFLFKDGQWYVQDNNSTNGTFVNGKKLDKGSRALLDKGSVIGLGPKVKFKINY
jgi:hypothetical protein